MKFPEEVIAQPKRAKADANKMSLHKLTDIGALQIFRTNDSIPRSPPQNFPIGIYDDKPQQRFVENGIPAVERQSVALNP